MNAIQLTARQPDVAQARALQSLYRVAGLAMIDPRVDSWAQLADPGVQELTIAAADMLREDADEPVELGWGELPAASLDPQPLFDALPPSAKELNAAYEATFGLLVSGNCPPYETEFIDSKLSFQRSQALADIAGFYRAFGWTPSLRFPERPDHIALELDFMATLCGMQIAACNDGQVAICCDAQAKFLAEHLLWWVPALAKLLAANDPRGFYGAAGRLLSALLPVHRTILGVPAHRAASPSANVRPSFVERPEECDGCLLQPSELG